MARIKIDFPAVVMFSTTLPVRITDINYGGHLGNDAILSMVHEARLQFLASLGFSEMDIAGSAIIMADAAIVFKSESFYGDTLRIEISVDEFTGIGCDIYYRITNMKTGRIAALVKTGIVFFNYASRKIMAVPDAFTQKIKIISSSSEK
jgi:acyl-CoA thioesterase FadM